MHAQKLLRGWKSFICVLVLFSRSKYFRKKKINRSKIVLITSNTILLTKNFTLTFIFWLARFAPLSPFLRTFSSAFHIPCHFQSQLHLGELFLTFLRSFKQIFDCTFKCTMIYTNICIIYCTGNALYICVREKLTTFWKYAICF